MITQGKWEVTGCGWERKNLLKTDKAFCPAVGIKNGLLTSHTPIAEVCGLGRSKEETQANAALIAAAPELLDFAKMMLDNKLEPDKLLCQIERFGVVAIAKAEGK